MICKRERLLRKDRRSKLASQWQSYKCYRNSVKKRIQQAHESYVNEVIGGSLEEENSKSFWNYVKLKRTESIGIPPLRDRNCVISSNSGKANVFNSFFFLPFPQLHNYNFFFFLLFFNLFIFSSFAISSIFRILILSQFAPS